MSAPPQALVNIELEQAFLGALLVRGADAIAAAPNLRPEHFGEPLHGRIYEVALRRQALGAATDAPLLGAVIADDPGLAAVGGPGYLVRMASGSWTSSAVREYATEIRALAARRALVESAASVIEAAQANPGSMRDAVAGLEAVAADAFDATLGRVRSRKGADVAETTLTAIADAYQSGAAPGVMSGLWTWDRLLGGFSPGHHVVVGGRPGMGKSAVAASLAWRLAEKGAPVLFVCCEMEPEETMLRMLVEVCAERGGVLVEYQAAATGQIEEQQVRALFAAGVRLAEWGITVVDAPGVSLADLSRDVRIWRRTTPIEATPVVFLDYLQLVSGPDPKAGRAAEVGAVSRGIKALARSTGACMVSLAQLSREVEKRADKRPILADLRDSGEIEQDADAVVMLYRDEVYAEREAPAAGASSADIEAHHARLDRARGKLEILVRKRRQGATGDGLLGCSLAHNRLWDERD